jgi:(p)ppGpp synthase/HD superfamily hydrolase
VSESNIPPRLGSDFAEALSYAVQLHAGQVRKGGEIPYIGHLLSVAALVIEADGSEAQVIAALLHDAAEDQGGDATLTEIASRFGPEVATIVSECSDTVLIPKPPWRERKELYVAHLEHAADETLLVSLADKLDNARAILRDVRSHGKTVWQRFNVSDPEEHLWYYGALLEIFKRRSTCWMVAELERTLVTLTGLVRAESSFARRRLAEVEEALDRTRSYIDEEESSNYWDQSFLAPGDPDDDWEYDSIAAVKRILEHSKTTHSALSAERDAIAHETEKRAP